MRRAVWIGVVLLLLAIVGLGSSLLCGRRTGEQHTERAPATAGGQRGGPAREARAARGEGPGTAPTPPPALVAPGEGEPFEIAGPGGTRIYGRRWAAASPDAPTLLLAPGPSVRAADWQPMVELLRSVRDYHLVSWDPPRLHAGGAAAGGAQPPLIAVLRHSRAVFFPRSRAVGIVGLRGSGTAALLLTAQRADIKAVVAVSPLPEGGLGDALDRLQRRQIMAVASAGDGRSAPAMVVLSALRHARLLRRAGDRGGLDLLRTDARVMTDINGWLFAAMGPPRRGSAGE